MSKTTKLHLDSLSVEAMLNYQKETFITFASCKSIYLMFNGCGEYKIVDKNSNCEKETKSPVEAMEMYKGLVENYS